MGRVCGTHGKKRRVLVGIPEGKWQLGRPICNWEHNIKKDLREIQWGYGLDSLSSGLLHVADHETLVSVGNFFEWLRNSWLLKKD
jgi:hypothetical protein